MSSSLAAIALLLQMATVTPAPISSMKEELLGGFHWRLTTSRGPIHVWRPKNFNRRSAGTVVYVHGYYTDVDTAWTEHRLAQQFADSGLNALFIAPEAPAGPNDEVHWTELRQLLKQVHASRVGIPRGPVVVVGHSGAYRTIVSWLAWGRVKEVILLDGLYEDEDDFERWLRRRSVPRNKLLLVGYETVIRSEAFCQRFRFAAKHPSVPTDLSEFSRRDRRSRLLYLASQHDHMALVTEGRVIPLLLQLTALKR